LVLGGSAAVDEHARPGLYEFPAAGRWWSANRTALQPGFVTGSLDGSPVAPLMGDYAGYDVGTLRVRVGRTAIRVQWLVDRDARAGVDYDLDRLLPVLAADQRAGLGLVRAQPGRRGESAFTPGPYSREREYNVIAFDAWYLERMSSTGLGAWDSR
jgi:hypothetical protein